MEHKAKEKSKPDDGTDASLETKLELEILFMTFEVPEMLLVRRYDHAAEIFKTI